MPDPDLARWVVWAAGLLAADRVYCSVTDQARERLVLSLLAGVVLAHLGWALLHLPRAIAYPYSVLEPGAASILLLPLGLLLIAPWREALAALPLALGVSRLGCLPYDCCYPTPWNALPELAGMVGLHFAARRWPLHATPIVLCGFGAIRLVSLPLRRDLAVEPFIDPAWIASAWIVAGVALRNRLGSAEDAREWFTEWAEPLLRALVVMLVVWLLFPLVAEVFSDSSASVLVASSGALARIIHEGRVLDGDQ